MARIAKFFCIIIGLGACLAGGFSTAAGVDFTYRGAALWGRMEDAAIDGKHLFCAMNHGLMILDITDPTAPTVVSRYPFLEGSSTSIAVSGNYAFMGVGVSMKIIDISDVASPQAVGQFPVLEKITSIRISGTTAFVCDEWTGVWVVDISDPANPVEVGFFSFPSQNGDETCIVRGNYLYAAGWWNLWIVDVSDPADPQQVGHYHAPAPIWKISLSETMAYLAVQTGLVVVDVSDPAAPVEISQFPINAPQTRTIALEGNVAYMGLGWPADGNGVKLVDISDPSQPVLSGQIPIWAYELNTSLGRLFVSDRYKQYGLFDVSDPGNPQMLSADAIAFYGYAGYGQEMAINGDYLYIAGGDMGLVIVNIADPDRPTVVREHVNPNRCYGLDLSDRYVYLVNDTNFHTEGLQVIDVSEPTEPVIVGSLELPSCEKVKVAGNYAFVGGSNLTKFIVDISDPANPVEIGSLYVNGAAIGFAAKDNYWYISHDWGIVVADISDASQPAILNTVTADADYGEILIYKGYLVCAVNNGIQVMDISTDPSSPTPVAFCGCRPDDIKPYGDYLFVGNRQGVSVIDMTDPLDPQVIGTRPLVAGAGAVAPYYGGVAAYDPDGLTMLQVDMPECCTHPGDANDDLTTNLADAVYLINYIFKNGPPLFCPRAGDPNGDCSINVGDAVYLVNYIFRSGDAPVCAACP